MRKRDAEALLDSASSHTAEICKLAESEVAHEKLLVVQPLRLGGGIASSRDLGANVEDRHLADQLRKIGAVVGWSLPDAGSTVTAIGALPEAPYATTAATCPAASPRVSPRLSARPVSLSRHT